MTKTLLPTASLLALALAASACTVSTLRLPLAPPGVAVRPEVARGFAAYETRLAPWGTWGPDERYGVHWCPNDADASFQPYLSRGHWGVSEAPIGHAPAGSPVWQSEDADTWGDVTTHHGWWVRVPGRRTSPWCWVPGAEETPAQVVWREGDGFVGWAPEGPDDVMLVDEVDCDTVYDWTYTLLGTLLDAIPSDNALSGEARTRAERASAPHRAPNGSARSQRVGPSGDSVQAARKELVDYVLKHPDAIAAISGKGASGGSGSKSSSSKSAKTEAKDTKDAVTVTAAVAPMPTAMGYYDAFLMEPAMGPAGLVPQMRSSAPSVEPKAAATPLASAPAASSAGLGSLSHGHGLHSAEAALRAAPSAPATSVSGSHGAVTHVSGSSSHSSGHSSSRSSSKSSSRSSGKSHR